MKKILFSMILAFSFTFVLSACSDDEEPGDPNACVSQSTDFAECLSCCQSNGFSGASLPLDASGNTTTCECR
ncbi:MAG: hypothetical protein LAT68_05975 [Cyclobacteriaceae bacterium]|nr:hypothetical protein [Cyclobacteriaceae bacterium]MCH8515859.1 hypothetical protein [Cyclobacteriaceae bacterium]